MGPNGGHIVTRDTPCGTVAIVDVSPNQVIKTLPGDSGRHSGNVGAKQGGAYACVAGKFANDLDRYRQGYRSDRRGPA